MVITVERRLSERYFDKRHKSSSTFYLEKSLSALDNGLCLTAKAFKFQTNLVTMSSRKTECSDDSDKA